MKCFLFTCIFLFLDSKSVNTSITLLKEASAKLQDILTTKFNDAVSKKDPNTVERFFKLFPLLGMHEYGLQKYSDYLAEKVIYKST